eukprot:142881_1
MMPTTLYILFMICIAHAQSDTWYYAGSQLSLPLGRGLVGYNNETATVYIFGGTTNTQTCGNSICCQNSIYKLNMNDMSNEWSKLNTDTPSSCFTSRIAGSVSINDLIYFMGIDNGSSAINQVHVFDTKTEQFTNDQSIPLTPHEANGGCVSANDSHIFFMGGTDGNGQPIHFLQILDVNTKDWSVVEIDEQYLGEIGLRSQLCSVVNNYLYILGGKDIHSISSNRIYKFDISQGNWIYVGELSINCYDGWSVYSMKHHKIYTIQTSVVQVFDVNTEQYIGSSSYRIRINMAPSLIYDDILIIIGGNVGSYMYSTFVQLAELPLLPVPTMNPTMNPTLQSKTSNSGVDTGWVVLICCVNSFLCVSLGCFIGNKCMNRNNNHYMHQNVPLQQFQNDNHGSMDDTISTSAPPRLM